jgi:hypothetical protein
MQQGAMPLPAAEEGVGWLFSCWKFDFLSHPIAEVLIPLGYETRSGRDSASEDLCPDADDSAQELEEVHSDIIPSSHDSRLNSRMGSQCSMLYC